MLRNIISGCHSVPKRIGVSHKARSKCNSTRLNLSVRWITSNDNQKENLPGGLFSRYEPLVEILDVEEERKKIESNDEKPLDEFYGINLQRGKTGVFDIEELVNVLRREKAEDIFVAKIPSSYEYADYMVVVTGQSKRHRRALVEFVYKVYKRKMNRHDLIPKIEGKESNEWIAIDLENIILHVFEKSSREYYDLETLWSVGKEYDNKSLAENSVTSILEEYSNLLSSLTPEKNKGTV